MIEQPLKVLPHVCHEKRNKKLHCKEGQGLCKEVRDLLIPPHVHLVEHAELSAAPIWVKTRFEELDAPLANGLPMPLSNHTPIGISSLLYSQVKNI